GRTGPGGPSAGSGGSAATGPAVAPRTPPSTAAVPRTPPPSRSPGRRPAPRPRPAGKPRPAASCGPSLQSPLQDLVGRVLRQRLAELHRPGVLVRREPLSDVLDQLRASDPVSTSDDHDRLD